MGQEVTSTVTMGHTEDRERLVLRPWAYGLHRGQVEVSTGTMGQVETRTLTMGHTEDRERLVLGPWARKRPVL